MKGISIVFNLYLPDKHILEKILESFERQEINSQIELIVIDKKTDEIGKNMIKKFSKIAKRIKTRNIKVDSKLNFAESMNIGLKQAKHDKIVVIQQDCIPSSKQWLKNLVTPLEKRDIVATTSRVIYPRELWDSMNVFTKSIMLNERGIITPRLDEKACGYKKEIFRKIGFFNENEFRTAGEDYDLYLKLKKIGKIAYPDASVYHYHPMNLKNRIAKIKQYSNGFGVLFRKNGIYLPRWYSGLVKSIPVLGIVGFILAFPYKKGISLFPIYLLLTPLLNLNYMIGFWKGFLGRKQEIDIFPNT